MGLIRTIKREIRQSREERRRRANRPYMECAFDEGVSYERFQELAQEAFFVPDDIATGVLTGKYKIFGGVVRHAIGPNKGRIVKHLKPVDMKEAEAAQGTLAKVIHIVKENPKAAIAVGVGTKMGDEISKFGYALTDTEAKDYKELLGDVKQISVHSNL